MSFRFDVLEATKPLYTIGETVNIRYTIFNDGEVADAEIIVTDTDTFQELRRIVIRNVISSYGGNISIGSMPNHDWRLRVVVNP